MLTKWKSKNCFGTLEALCWCTVPPPPPAQKSRHQKPRKSHESDQRAQIGRPCIPDIFSVSPFNQNCYFFFFKLSLFLLLFLSAHHLSSFWLNIINHSQWLKTVFETFFSFSSPIVLQITVVRKIKFNCKLFFQRKKFNSIWKLSQV